MNHTHNHEKKTLWVVAITAATMVVEIIFGLSTKSMALLADGIHMGSHVLAIGLSLGGPTGYAINPVRDLGPRIMHAILPIGKKGSSDWAYAWIPVVGPMIGAVLAALLFMALPK